MLGVCGLVVGGWGGGGSDAWFGRRAGWRGRLCTVW